MKTNKYIAPSITVVRINSHQIIATSITDVSGPEGLGVSTEGTSGVVTEGAVKQESYNVWEDDWSK